jgi:hypothetical protein
LDRQFVFPDALPLDTDLLNIQREVYTGFGLAMQDLLGSSLLFSGLACTATAPASLNVLVAPGRVYSVQQVDPNAFGSLAAVTAQSILKQGILALATTLSCPAPGTSGQSINYLIEAQFQENDGTAVVYEYFNASNINTPLNGPDNSGTAQNSQRLDQLVLLVKGGIAATTGTQTTPAPDAGYTGLYVVTVANGQTQITSGNISVAPGAPFLTETLTQKISQATGDARYLQIANTGAFLTQTSGDARYLQLANTSNFLTGDGVNKPTSALVWAKPLTLNNPADGTNLTLGRTGGTNNPTLAFSFTDSNNLSKINASGQLQLAVGGSTALTLASTGLTVAAPATSGTALTVNGFPGVTALQVNGNGNNSVGIVVVNNSPASGAVMVIDLNNGTDVGTLEMQGTGMTSFITGAPNGSYFGIGMNTAQPIGLMTNLTERMRIDGTGHVTVNAPTSGNSLLVNGPTGGTAIVATAANGAAAFGAIIGSGSALWMGVSTGYFSTGSATATHSNNKPGANNSTIGWLSVALNGTPGWVEVLGN